MAAAAVKGAHNLLSRGAQALGGEGRSLLAALEAVRLREETAPPRQPAPAAQPEAGRREFRKTVTIHIGADLYVPVSESRYTPPAAPAAAAAATAHGQQAPQPEGRRDPFEGVPLRAWAERLGERLMPAYELLKEEQQRAKAAERAGAAEPRPLAVPAVPHLLPFTRWAASSKRIQDTFIAEDTATRKKARLSWYHPDDTMVPRGWLRDGLLKDLQYYAPFRSASAPAPAP